MESPWCATGISPAHNGGAKSWVEAIAGSAGTDACASTGRMATQFSAIWCATGGEASEATPADGGESKDIPPIGYQDKSFPTDRPERSTDLHQSLCDHSETARDVAAEIDGVYPGE